MPEELRLQQGSAKQGDDVPLELEAEEERSPMEARAAAQRQTARTQAKLSKEFEAAARNPRYAEAAHENFRRLVQDISVGSKGPNVPRVAFDFARLPTKLKVPYDTMLASMRETLIVTINHIREVSVPKERQSAANQAKALAHIICEDLEKAGGGNSEVAHALTARGVGRIIVKVDIGRHAIPLADVILPQSEETKANGPAS